ncbi:penicillin-binding protein 1A [Vibrio cholerae]|nr:penicillin-binding protein 1A [Vibrio cholerae]MBN7285343.1 PBP1A family penicillin-binding protein [Vibrio paracholerae]MBW5417542.1 PBP1A family penicillin-binding protein [Vibrio cholerae]MBW5431915.1 PBP1A family penicillin-binding protein [Vibrio cholerae]MEB5596437.1 PBP1A family penicillin-binding protein [Vibrio cholerae]
MQPQLNRNSPVKFIKRLLVFSLICIILGVTTIFGFYFYVKSDLPDVATLRDVQLQTPMQVFSQDGKLIAQFGEKRRIPLKLEEMPKELIEAVIATEDSRYYEHYGFDPIGITRAAFAVLASGSASQGASTITQQLARNFFLSNEKKVMRKVKEIFIAIHIEQLLSKEEILELYLNKIYLGYRSYGVGAAAQAYFGKEVKDLTLGEIALIAGLPKAPSTMNPIYSVERATNRRNVVLQRMLDEKYITKAEYDAARAERVQSKFHGAEIELNAPYVAEIARAWMVERYGEEVAYTSGMNVYTTVDSKLQKAANQAAINNLLAYDERHGYRGAEKELWQANQPAWSSAQLSEYLSNEPTYGDMFPAAVLSVEEKSAQVWVKSYGVQTIAWEDMNWARRFINDDRQGPLPKSANEFLAAGEQIWVRPRTQNGAIAAWKLTQVPNANTAFVAMNPENGAVTALVGGFNFVHNKFNRATQSVRQVGSSIKPFIYSAALNKGLTLATLINDAPINQWDESQGTAWRPKNSPPTYTGPTRLRIGLAQSKNVMAVRVLREVGLDETREYLTRFGFKLDQLPRSETIALGAGSLTPVQMAQGFSVFANNGYFVEPFYISRVENPFGNIEFTAEPKVVCRNGCSSELDEFAEQDAASPYAPKVISEQNAFLTREMLYSNIWGGGEWSSDTGWNGTGWRAQALKRRDIGGKTGTTNDSKDAWYNGYAPGIVSVAWVGFDDHSRNLGKTAPNRNIEDDVSGAESGGKTALPAWVEFMSLALQGVPVQQKVIPNNIVRVRIDRDSGLLTNKLDSSSMFEYFEAGTEPTEYVSEHVNESIYSTSSGEELF